MGFLKVDLVVYVRVSCLKNQKLEPKALFDLVSDG